VDDDVLSTVRSISQRRMVTPSTIQQNGEDDDGDNCVLLDGGGVVKVVHSNDRIKSVDGRSFVDLFCSASSARSCSLSLPFCPSDIILPLADVSTRDSVDNDGDSTGVGEMQPHVNSAFKPPSSSPSGVESRTRRWTRARPDESR